MRHTGWACALLLLASCQRAEGVSTSEVDAGASSATGAATRLRTDFALARTALRADGTDPDRVVGYVRESDGLRPTFADRSLKLSIHPDRVLLPARASEGLVLEKGAMRVRASLRATAIAPREDAGMLIYAGALPGGTLAYAPRADGAEEFALYESAPSTEHALRYDVKLEGVAGLRLVDGTLEFLTADGNPVLRTSAPITFDAKGNRARGTLSVEGCNVDFDASPPWDRPVTDPGNTSCTVVAHWSDEGLAYPIAVDPAWTTTGALGTKRLHHNATFVTATTGSCTAGCVLVTDGETGTTTAAVTASAELWRPATGTWTALAADPCGARSKSAAAFDGVGAYVAGGRNSAGTPLACVSKYTVSTGTWSTIANMPGGARTDLAGTTLWQSTDAPAGVAFAGGRNASGNPVTTVEQWGGSWQTSNLVTARYDAAFVSWWTMPGFTNVMPSCVIGGTGASGRLSSVECTTNLKGGTTSWVATATPMAGSRATMGVAQYKNQVFIGGGGVAAIDTIDLLAAGAPTLSHTGASLVDRDDLTGAVALQSATATFPHALFLGGVTAGLGGTALSTADLYDTTSGLSTSAMLFKRHGGRAVQLADGRVMATGGNAGTIITYSFPANEEIFALLANGASCTSNGECISAHCADGVCCNTACNGICEACNKAGSAGTCSPVAGAPTAGHGSCPAPSGGACGYQCDGANRTACNPAGVATVCTAAGCTGSTLTPVAKCDGAGSCATVTTTPCPGNYSCASATTCKTTCTVNTDCAAGYKCMSGTCITTGEKGAGCTGDTDCASGHCADGGGGKKVCCSTATCDAGMICGDIMSSTPGECIKKAGTACGGPSECVTGFCVDGVCCDQLCGGQCQACDISGAVGKCTGVNGDPHGSRPKCSDGGSNVCAALTCDGGKDLTKCGAYAHGLDFECSKSCTDGTLSQAFCDNAGACQMPKSTTCAGFACDGNNCRTTCTDSSHCIAGYSCNTTSGKCENIKAKCSDDGHQSLPTDGKPAVECGAYLCDRSTGGCFGTCTSSDQCASGFICGGDSKCVGAPAGDTGDSGGCSMSPTPSDGHRPSAMFAALGLLATALVVRRKLHNQ